jgi:hypothetical protein
LISRFSRKNPTSDAALIDQSAPLPSADSAEDSSRPPAVTPNN